MDNKKYAISVNDVSANDTKDLNALLKHLSERSKPQTAERWDVVARSNLFLVCRDTTTHKIVGMTLLVLIPQPFDLIGRIEDVAVHPDHERRGIFRALMEEALRLASKAHYKRIRLTSNPNRSGARAFYEGLGFQFIGETGKFELLLDKGK